MRRPPTRSLAAPLLGIALTLTIGACGDEPARTTVEAIPPVDDDHRFDPPSPTPGPDGAPAPGPQDFCGAVLAVTGSGGPAVPPDASDEERVTAEQAYVEGVLLPAVEVLRTSAPTDLAADVETFAASVEALADEEPTPDPRATLEAQDRIVVATVRHCGWTDVAVTGTEYTFEGVPATLAPGTTVFRFANEGREMHEAVVLRKADGVTASFEELLSLPEEEGRESFTVVTAFAPTTPGEAGPRVADLAPGDYGIVCTVPVGTTSVEALDDGATTDQHFVRGQIAEFTVG